MEDTVLFVSLGLAIGDGYASYSWEVQIPRKRGGRQGGKVLDKNIFCSYKKYWHGHNQEVIYMPDDINDLFQWDSVKNVDNQKKHGLSFDQVREFDFTTAFIVEDIRNDYDEIRYIAYGYNVTKRVMCLVYTPREDFLRIISYRKANKREQAKFKNEVNIES